MSIDPFKNVASSFWRVQHLKKMLISCNMIMNFSALFVNENELKIEMFEKLLGSGCISMVFAHSTFCACKLLKFNMHIMWPGKFPIDVCCLPVKDLIISW